MVTIGVSKMTMLRFTVALLVEFVAMTEKLNVPATVGIPVIAPFVAFKLKPAGSVPLDIDHVIGVVPVALSL